MELWKHCSLWLHYLSNTGPYCMEISASRTKIPQLKLSQNISTNKCATDLQSIHHWAYDLQMSDVSICTTVYNDKKWLRTGTPEIHQINSMRVTHQCQQPLYQRTQGCYSLLPLSWFNDCIKGQLWYAGPYSSLVNAKQEAPCITPSAPQSHLMLCLINLDQQLLSLSARNVPTIT